MLVSYLTHVKFKWQFSVILLDKNTAKNRSMDYLEILVQERVIWPDTRVFKYI